MLESASPLSLLENDNKKGPFANPRSGSCEVLIEQPSQQTLAFGLRMQLIPWPDLHSFRASNGCWGTNKNSKLKLGQEPQASAYLKSTQTRKKRSMPCLGGSGSSAARRRSSQEAKEGSAWLNQCPTPRRVEAPAVW